MREIKFRAKELLTGQFIYGSYVTDYKDYHAILRQNPDDDMEMLNTPVDPETLGQFTGEKDCDRADKYEHDVLFLICEDKSTHTVVVRYSDRCEKFIYHPVGEVFDFDRDVVSNPFKRGKYKVAGNIHENPELLEENNEPNK